MLVASWTWVRSEMLLLYMKKPVDVQAPRLLHSRTVRINDVLRQVGRQLRSLSDVDGEMMQNKACFQCAIIKCC